MQAVGLSPNDDWAAFFQHLFKTYSPTQPLVSGLAAIMRGSLTSAQQPATTTSALLVQMATALYSIFETRDALMAFLNKEFPDQAAKLSKEGTYGETLSELAILFERQGQTETLIGRALAHQPDNLLLQEIQKQLTMAVSDAPEEAKGLRAVVEGERGIAISGDVLGATLSTRGSFHIAGDVIGSTINLLSRTIPHEEFDTLPKAMPPFTTADPPGQVWAPPELVFNWALGLRLAMRAVCLVEGSAAMGTGFLAAPNLLLYATGSPRDASHKSLSGTRFRFDYCHAPDGSLGKPTVYILAGDWQAAINENLGYILFRLEGSPGTDLVPGENVPRGWLTLTHGAGRGGPESVPPAPWIGRTTNAGVRLGTTFDRGWDRARDAVRHVRGRGWRSPVLQRSLAGGGCSHRHQRKDLRLPGHH